MRACIEGHPPPSAIERHAKDSLRPIRSLFRRRYPLHLLEVIDWAMEVDPLLRPQDAGSMLTALIEETGHTALDSRPAHSRPSGMIKVQQR